MARGESPKERPLSIGLAIVAVVAVASMCAVFSVVASMRTGSSAAVAPYVVPTPIEPFRGATASFGTLSSRDSVRALLFSGSTLTRDPSAARHGLEGTLRDRGYVEGASAETAAHALPFDAAPADLDGACGVVALFGDVGTTITRAGIAGGRTFRSVDPSAFTIATCGTGDVHAEGTGNVTMRTWLFPGLTPSMLASTGLAADALLAHAEAETMLRRRGFVPVDEILETTPSAATAGGFLTAPLPTVPGAGCVPFVAYVEGAGRPQIAPGRFDFLDDRGLVGAVSCATVASSWAPLVVDDGAAGARVLWRAYAAAPAGATLSTAVTIGSAHTVDAAHATWPTPIAEAR